MRPPPSGLRAGLGAEPTKRPLVDWVFDGVADRYDLGNDLMSLGWHTTWKERLVHLAGPRPGERALDLATGTGDVAFAIARRTAPGEVVGLDLNPAMLAIARRKHPPELAHLRFLEGDATALPFPDEHFDLVTIGYAGRGFPSWERVLAEVWRVLRPGGRFVNLDFARPPNRTWDRLYRGWMTVSGAVLGTVLHGHPKIYVYIPESMRAYPGQRWLDARMKDQGFATRLVETRACLMAYNVGVKPPRSGA
jgi:demethylmenaquinone methyltransferase/2-methoxy-6-polyprenyl-1,4-benzoquinol methylase